MMDGSKPSQPVYIAQPESLSSVINHILDVRKKDFGNLAVRAKNFDGWFAERLRAAQIVNFSAKAVSILGNDFDIVAVEHALQLFHH